MQCQGKPAERGAAHALQFSPRPCAGGELSRHWPTGQRTRPHSPEFRQWWRRHEVDAPCQGVRALDLPDLGEIDFEHTSLVVDESRHLRLVIYAVREGEPKADAFASWLVEA
ncbi:hypothetical protein [Salinicola endophyticus]|uniref:MmyB-like transcription regulator ligand binding domain-containing protein n=1 Tax=Salinicola endophyticus TaxID=1949083 RepID=A0AB74U4E3_9GAMM